MQAHIQCMKSPPRIELPGRGSDGFSMRRQGDDDVHNTMERGERRNTMLTDNHPHHCEQSLCNRDPCSIAIPVTLLPSGKIVRAECHCHVK